MKTRGGSGTSTTWPGVRRHDRRVPPFNVFGGRRDNARWARETIFKPILNEPISLSSRNWTTNGAGRFLRA